MTGERGGGWDCVKKKNLDSGLVGSNMSDLNEARGAVQYSPDGVVGVSGAAAALMMMTNHTPRYRAR